jgi:hypothetical protein
LTTIVIAVVGFGDCGAAIRLERESVEFTRRCVSRQ